MEIWDGYFEDGTLAGRDLGGEKRFRKDDRTTERQISEVF